MSERWPLDLSPEQMGELVDASMRRIEQFLLSLEQQPVDGSAGVDHEALRKLKEPLPQEPSAFDPLLDSLFDDLAPLSLNPAAPGFMGYVPGGGILHVGVADLISNSLNKYTGVAGVAPALNQIEANVIRWFCELLGYPPEARGFLTSGGSMANWSALVTARYARLGENFSRGTLYTSDQAHHCVAKAARLAGFPAANVRVLPSDDNYRLSPAAVREAVHRDRERGFTPAILIASAGTTNTGAVDPLAELAALAREEKLWFHVDAAYGGFFHMTARGRDSLKGIEQADSMVLDPHKTLFLPYGTGALLVRDAGALKAIHSSSGDYMPPMHEDEDFMDFCEFSPELTRPFRGLRVWLPFKLHGIGAFRNCLDEKLDLARWIEAEIGQLPQLEILAPPTLSIMAFALRDTGQALDLRNAATRRLLECINAGQKVNLTGTTLKGVYAIRIAIGSFRTHREHLQVLLQELNTAITAVGLQQEAEGAG